VLDAGKVPGHVPIARALPGRRIDGLDLAGGMIEQARQNATAAGLAAQVDFVVGDVGDLLYPDRTFDLVVSTMSQHHWPDVDAGLRELRRVLRPGGRVWIYDLRFALRRAAAREAFPGHVVRREPLGTGLLRLSRDRGDLTRGSVGPGGTPAQEARRRSGTSHMRATATSNP
jgi:SAM-dependent methyltransferase